MNRVTLRRVELEAAGACPEGMGLFEWLVDAQDRDDSVLIREWTQLHSIWLATRYPDLSVWLVSHGLIPSLSGADLTGAYLTWANLTRANLTGADLTRAYYPTGEVPEGWTRGADGYLSARRASRGPASTPHRRSGSARPCAAK